MRSAHQYSHWRLLPDEDGGLERGEHVGDAPLHEEAAAHELRGPDHGHVDGGDHVTEVAHREGPLEIPVLDSPVCHRPVRVPL